MPPEMVIDSFRVHEKVVRQRLQTAEERHKLALEAGTPAEIAKCKKLFEVAKRDLAQTLSMIRGLETVS